MKKLLYVFYLATIYLHGMQSGQNNYKIITTFNTMEDVYQSAACLYRGLLYVGKEALNIWNMQGNMVAYIKPDKEIDALGVNDGFIAYANCKTNKITTIHHLTYKKIAEFGGKDVIDNLYDIAVDGKTNTIAVLDVQNDNTNSMKLFDCNGNKLTQFPISPNMDPGTFDFQFTQNTDLLINFMDLDPSSENAEINKSNLQKPPKKLNPQERLKRLNYFDTVKNFVKHKMLIYDIKGYPQYVWDADQYTWVSPATDPENNIIVPGGCNKIYYYQQNGNLIKILTGNSLFNRPVVSNRDDTIYYVENNYSENTTSMIALDPETNHEIGKLTFPTPSDSSNANEWIFLDQETQHIVIVIGKNACVIAKK